MVNVKNSYVHELMHVAILVKPDISQRIKIICTLIQGMKLQTIFWKEGDMYVIKDAATGVTTQCHTIEGAMANIKEAVALYLEEMPDVKKSIQSMNVVGALSVEIP